MALTDYDKKNLSSADQQKIQAATEKWNAANAKGDTAGMASAAAEAAAVRNNAGYKTDSSGNYSGAYTGSTSSGGSSYTNSQYTQYTPTGSYNDAGLPTSVKTQIDNYKALYNDAMSRGDTAAAERAHRAAESLRSQYGYSGGGDGSEYIELLQKIPSYEFNESQPTFNSNYDYRIDEILNQILNREDFSYDVTKDDLYKQYAAMYQREGDRAMRETMAEAAAGAGGMNSYAMTAAQQAYNYYGSQLNDKIPELYDLAYQMYLNDKESEIQNLGILQNMDATQYNRYRDTMSDYYNDRNFAYNMYRNDVSDAQWNQNFDFESDWANKEFDYKVEQDALKNSQYEKETAREDVWKLIEAGIPVSDELLAKAGYSDNDNKYNGGDGGSYSTVSNDVAAMVANGDKNGAKTYLQEALNAGYITWSECAGLLSKYGL